MLLSAAPGWEFPDWGGVDHVGGGSHGSLHRSDSLGALAFCGVEPPGGAAPRAVVDRRRRADGARALRGRLSTLHRGCSGTPRSVSRPSWPPPSRCSPCRLRHRSRRPRRADRARRRRRRPTRTARSRCPTWTSRRPGAGSPARRSSAIAERAPGPAAHAARAIPGSFAERLPQGARALAGEPVHARQARARRSPSSTSTTRRGRVTEAWTGFQVALDDGPRLPRRLRAQDQLAVGLDPAARSPSSLPFLDPRRPLRMLHLDLLVLAGFGVSVAFFNDAQIGISVPLVYPLLVYLLARMLWIGLRARRAAARAAAPARARRAGWRSALVFLIGFRIALNVMDSNVIDVGYAGVIGADRLADGERAVGQLPERQRARRHVRAGQLRRLPAVRAGLAVEAALGRPARRPRRGDRLRPRAASALLFFVGPARARARPRASCSPTRGRRSRSRSTR